MGKDRRFERDLLDPECRLSYIGDGELGGKAEGLRFIRDTIDSRIDGTAFEEVRVSIPRLTVITTAFFDAFMQRNDLYEVAGSGLPDDRLAHRFQRADLPMELVGDLRSIIAQVRTPIAVRSSSLLEDDLDHPFAGVYATKMTPNNQLDVDSRFRKLAEAIKFVYASTFFRESVTYRKAIGGGEEKMAVILQEVVGRRYGGRYYPNISGVARSYNFYPSGRARPEDGVAELALGLGKTIVDDGVAWSYSPAYPKAPPPYNTLGDLMKTTQTEFWSVNMGQAPYDPVQESEYLVKSSLREAEADDTLRFVAATYDPHTNRIAVGAGMRGPRVVTFAPLLVHNQVPVNAMVRALLEACGRAVGGPVEIEFALTLDPVSGTPADCGFLQVRRMAVAQENVEISEQDLSGGGRVLVVSDTALGNGMIDSISDIVYVKPEKFDPRSTEIIAHEVESLNEKLVRAGRPYLLIGFGRWGTTDPTGGIPVQWGHISGARAIVETQLPNMRAELSQGSHFFHNLTSFRVLYFSIPHGRKPGVDWRWCDQQTPAAETQYLRHICLPSPLQVKVDGRSGKGVVLHA